ncbi:hypothetical protein [Shimazuella kribbensis]|uniref:hypothetical protein n=1 Tax=Shimazuella kribbensis TaxID=139808 RepID=UPI000419D166|nr:hypothetical protein [Shimazuella kribbensis]
MAKFFRFFVFLYLFVTMLSSNSVYGAETQTELLQKKIDQLELELDKSNLVDEKLKMLEKNNDQFQADLQKDQENLFSTFNFFIAVTAFLFGIMAVVLSITIGQSRKEFKENINDSMNIMKTDVEQQFDAELKESLQRNKQHFQESIEEERKVLQQMIERELAYKKVRVLITGSKEDLHLMKARELKPIERRGISDITIMPFDEQLFREKLFENTFDIVVYRYKTAWGNNQDARIRVVVDELTKAGSDIPLIVYNYENGKVEGEDKRKLEEYLWTRYANVPATLGDSLITIAYAFSK